jgi:hypothetical protein
MIDIDFVRPVRVRRRGMRQQRGRVRHAVRNTPRVGARGRIS